MRTLFLSCLSMLAFAGNSVLCRLALAEQQIDPASFTGVRLVSGAFMLVLILSLSKKNVTDPASLDTETATGRFRRSVFAACALFAYAIFFSYAYLSLDTATGALVLFGVVQITLISIGIAKGQTLKAFEWVGLVLACVGFVYLLLPELNKPTLSGLLMMSIAGVAWGVYTAIGQGSVQPLNDTRANFVFTVPLVLILAVVCLLLDITPELTTRGILLAVVSGAITSALGYAIWYLVLPKLETTLAAVMQLSVPAIAAVLGLLLVNETPSFHLLVSGFTILLGIFIVIMARSKSF